MNTNPFLQKNTNPFQAIPFDKIKSEHFLPAIKEGITQAKSNLELIKKNTTQPDFANTIEALESCSELLDLVTNTYYVLFSAEAPKELQALAPEVASLHSSFSTDVSLDEELFLRIKSVYDSTDQTKLSTEQKAVLEKTYKSFTRNGALLDKTKKEELRKINQELSQLAPKFSENVLAATNAYELIIDDEKRLKGLPESAKEAAQELAEKKGHAGKWMFSLQAPSMLPALTYLEDEVLRKEIWMASAKKCLKDKFDNTENIKEIIKFRHQRAKLLGYNSHAQYVLEERMAQSPEMVISFLERILKYSKPAADRDLNELAAFKKFDVGHDLLQPWDVRFYEEKLKMQKFNIDQEVLRPYFELERVYKGAFELVEMLYGISFEPIHNVPVYHEDVKVFEVVDINTSEHIGLFYMDFFPRETKRGGAWMTNMREQGLFENEVRRPHVSIVMNFTKPTKTKPSLLTFEEVSTFFHEFGHALHGLLSRCKYRSVSGTSVYWDFVELPSQFMENWILEKEVIDLFAVHYETGDKLPIDLFKKLKESAKFLSGFYSMRQLTFGFLDMKWHTADPTKINDVIDFETKAIEQTQVLPKIPDTSVSTSFSHIFAGGYSSGYYSYKWAEVLDADAFEYFKENGLFNKEIAKGFRENILEKGGSDHPMKLYKNFRGREPDPDALLKRDGLLT